MTHNRSQVQAQFGAHAQNYVASIDHAQGESLDKLLELLPFQPNWRALDIATGGGHTALALAPRVAEVVASDITAEMLAAAEKFLIGKGVTNATFKLADAGTLPFARAEFDLVTCRLAAHHFPQAGRFVQESARVLKPGGWFALIDNVTSVDAVSQRYVNAFETLRDPSHAWEYSAVDWEAFCQAAGLQVAHLLHYRKPLDFEPWCDRLSVPPPVRQQLRMMLWQASAAGREALQPKFSGTTAEAALHGPITFSLGEILLITHS